jgi:hypothetical protein
MWCLVPIGMSSCLMPHASCLMPHASCGQIFLPLCSKECEVQLKCYSRHVDLLSLDKTRNNGQDAPTSIAQSSAKRRANALRPAQKTYIFPTAQGITAFSPYSLTIALTARQPVQCAGTKTSTLNTPRSLMVSGIIASFGPER